LAWLGNLVILHTYPPMKMEQSAPKRRHIKLRRRGITQKKAYNTDTVLFKRILFLVLTLLVEGSLMLRNLATIFQTT